MARKRKTPEGEWDATAASAFMTEQFRAELIGGKSGIESSAAAAAADVGIRLPHLCLRYLFQRTSFPLQRVMVIFGPSGCLAGDTVIRTNRATLGRKMSIKHVVHMLNGGTASGKKWDQSIPTYVARAVGDRARLVKLKSAWACGVKETFTLLTEGGRSIRATAEHPFMTEDGNFVRLGDLRPGDSIRVNVGRTKNPRRRKRYPQRFTKYHPNQYLTGRGEYYTPEHHIAYEAKLNGLSFAEMLHAVRKDATAAAQLQYRPKGVIVHHVDGDHRNNHPDNLQVVESQAEHNEHHWDEIDGNVLPKIGTDVVRSIVRYGEEETYDMEVEDDPHCYLANDFVVHNSNKSTLLYYFYDLFRRAKGKYLHAELEDKDTPIMRLSLTEYDEEAGWVKPCRSLDEMQSSVRQWFDWFKARCSRAGGPGRRVPFVIGADSLVAKLTEGAAKTIAENDGVPGRRFADEARSLSDWFKLVPDYLQGWPFSFMAVNHDKPKTENGQTIHHTPGGSAPNYYATYKILSQKVRTLKQSASGWEGNRVRLSMEKCALGTDKQHFEAEVVWRVTIGKSKSGKETPVQQTLWNWDKATVELLHAMVEKRKGTARSSAVSDILGLVKCTGGRYACKALGVPSSDPLPAAKMGKLLENSPEVLAQLEPRLGIHDSRHYESGVDFSDQLAAAHESIDDYIPAAVDPDAVVDGGAEGGGPDGEE